ncbi:hypothetical protein IGI04_042985 [Brassica rapa subsp. trilocularis]|uniref:Uncharacterized protein n=1 Tax=Brassica rapa subsp. trilocularis TaxID=1813537 RepID=A0ABQ7KI01_BRACM|nr:hypothetical protein IGI04_042985 [Brassica rapa subsp. trilocularis]
MGVRQHTQDVCGCLWLSVSTHRTSMAVRVCPCISVSTHRTYVAIYQYTYQHAGPWTQHAALPVDCSGDFGPRVLSVQYTQDVRGCQSAHTGRPLLSVCVRQHTQDFRGCLSVHISARWSLDSARCPSRGLFMTSVAIRVCPSAHTGRPWLSISTHISTLVLGLSTLALPWTVRVILAHVGYLFSRHRTSVEVRQHTQDVRVCPSAHTGRPWLSVCVRVCPSAHRRRLWLSVSTHISTVLGLSMLNLPVECLGDFGPRGLSVQYTQDVRGCPPAHTRCLWLSVAVRQHTQDVHGCPCMSVSTHRTYVAVYQYTYQHAGPWTQHAALPVDCSGDFGPRGLSGQYTQDVRGCQSAHTGRPWLSVCVRACPAAHTGLPWLSISTHISTLVLGLSTLPFPWRVQVILVHVGCLFSTHRTSVGFRQHTQDVRCSHTGRPWLSISTHISTLVLGLSTLALPVDCLGDFGPCGLSVQYTQDVRGCLLAHKGRPWLSVAVRQHTQDVSGCPTLALPVDSSRDFGPRGLSVKYTQDVCGCLSAHTGRPCVSVSTHSTSMAVRVCPCVSISTHRMSVTVHQYTYQHVNPWTQHADPSRGLFG